MTLTPNLPNLQVSNIMDPAVPACSLHQSANRRQKNMYKIFPRPHMIRFLPSSNPSIKYRISIIDYQISKSPTHESVIQK